MGAPFFSIVFLLNLQISDGDVGLAEFFFEGGDGVAEAVYGGGDRDAGGYGFCSDPEVVVSGLHA